MLIYASINNNIFKQVFSDSDMFLIEVKDTKLCCLKFGHVHIYDNDYYINSWLFYQTLFKICPTAPEHCVADIHFSNFEDVLA